MEGAGDERALPVLVRRYLALRDEHRDLLGKPVTCHGREKATRDGGLEGFVAVAAARPGCRAVLVLLDADKDRVCALGPDLSDRLDGSGAARGKPVVIALADSCFEAWIYASAETLELANLEYTADTNPVAALKDALRPKSYVKPTWQPRLTNRVDLELARSRNHSLDRLLHKIDDILALF